MSKLKKGFTTGSCATAAATAACMMLFTGKEKNKIQISTPKGDVFYTDIENISITEGLVSCSVTKDGGDDPDITTGAHIYASVSCKEGSGLNINIDGGKGVGRVTKPGLDQPVGSPAINHVPRQMITKELENVCRLYDFTGDINVLIEVPEGEELAKKTFNPRLGIEGGISILGTSGIVEPMSSQALLDTIRVELNQNRALGYDRIVISPGNYGMDFLKSEYEYNLDKSVKCSNFIGDTIDIAIELGFKELLLVGHIGKLVKLSGGIMNTHSKVADSRMELIAAAAIKSGVSEAVVSKILECVVTSEAVNILDECGARDDVMKRIMEGCMFFLKKRAKEAINIECMMYSNEHGMLAKSSGAEALLLACRNM